MAKYHWRQLPPPDEHKVNFLMESLKIPRIFAEILVQKGIDTYQKAEEYFKIEISNIFSETYNPYLMKDMEKAVARISKAAEQVEDILIYGDYDVDGVTSVSIMYLFLTSLSFYKSCKHKIHYYLPDRYTEGYGISKKGIEFAVAEKCTLIIALDCGTKDFESLEYAQSCGIEVIICDHHEPEEKYPPVYAFLNPKRSDDIYPYKELTGCGVGFKLIQAFGIKNSWKPNQLVGYLDRVAISIAADVVPITGENRILAFLGLKQINENPEERIEIFISSELKGYFTLKDIVYKIAPKINAAGRLAHASEALKLLISDDKEEINLQYKKINKLNEDRKKLESKMTKEAVDMLEKDTNATIVFKNDWHKGVIGILASKLIDYQYKPTIVFTEGKDGELVASARSISDFDIYKALNKNAHFFTRFGGHKFAAGLSISKENFVYFKENFEKDIASTLTNYQKHPALLINLEINLKDISDKLFRLTQRMEPLGSGNPIPFFIAKNVKACSPFKTFGKEQQHLRFYIQQIDSKKIQTIFYNAKPFIDSIIHHSFDIVFSLENNVWKNKSYPHLLIHDIIIRI